jgi:hypothetical protein
MVHGMSLSHKDLWDRLKARHSTTTPQRFNRDMANYLRNTMLLANDLCSGT